MEQLDLFDDSPSSDDVAARRALMMEHGSTMHAWRPWLYRPDPVKMKAMFEENWVRHRANVKEVMGVDIGEMPEWDSDE